MADGTDRDEWRERKSRKCVLLARLDDNDDDDDAAAADDDDGEAHKNEPQVAKKKNET